MAEEEQNNENKETMEQDNTTETSTGENMSNDYSQEQSQLDLTQLEQRITSLEQRLMSVEHVEQPQSKPNDDEQTTDDQSDATDESSASDKPSDKGESLAEIEKMLDL